MNEKFANIIRQRINQRVPLEQLKSVGITAFYVGGNSLNRNPPNDIDIFPIGGLFLLQTAEKLGRVVSNTKNAITVKVNVDKTLHHQTVDGTNDIEVNGKTVTVQLCNYQHQSLETLVDSFDFSHIQVGAKVTPNNIEVYCTDNYEESKLCQSTEYFGSEYPISSLIRTFKYAKRGDFAGDSHIFSVLKILADISCRGFDSYDDFKNQLDAVDLGLVPENHEALVEAGLNFTEEGNQVLNTLYSSLCLGKKGIAKDATLSFEHAENMGKRFEDGEGAISTNSYLSIKYADFIIKGRFELAEKYIIQSTQDIWNYYTVLKKYKIALPEDMHNVMLGNALNNDGYARTYVRDTKLNSEEAA
jgi:hypothetical protein